MGYMRENVENFKSWKNVSFKYAFVKQLMADSVRSEDIIVKKHDKVTWKVLQINLVVNKFQRHNFLKLCYTAEL